MNHPYAASRDCGRRLLAAGCPMDYPNSLPCASDKYCQRLCVSQLHGYADSRLYWLGPMDASFVVTLRLGTDVPSGVVIADWSWSFVPPWECHVNWDYEGRDVIPKGDREVYENLFRSSLSAKLKERQLLARGRPVDGLLCGRIFEPIPEQLARLEIVYAKFTVTDTKGYAAAASIELNVYRYLLKQRARTNESRSRFSKRDSAVVGSAA